MLPEKFHEAEKVVPLGTVVPGLTAFPLMLMDHDGGGIIKDSPALLAHSQT
jgi:hypothetical protein